MKQQYRILLGIAYSVLIMFTFNILDDYYDEKSWITEQAECKEEYTIYWEVSPDVDEDWLDDIVEEFEFNQTQIDSLTDVIDNREDELRAEINTEYDKSDIDKLIDMFWVIFYLPNLIYIGLFGAIYTAFYLLFYSAKLWLTRYFK
jgi:hypothetical protein|tara:strand:- start:407 stop:844 length:438 start_codon:yes stop_codon:yes gene_type:complete